MKKNLYILATLFFGATALVGCSDDDNATPAPGVTPAQESDVVDLGLPSGTLWAKANLGAVSEFEDGNLYAWGETYTKTSFSASNYFDASSSIVKSDITGTDYDAAKAALGGDWVMPTEAQFKELFDNCKVTRVTLDEKNYLMLTGPNENVIYLPEVAASVVGEGTVYDSYLNEDDETEYVACENVFAAYWTGSISGSVVELNSNQYAKQLLYVEHGKNAIKNGGFDTYGNIMYDRSRLVGAAIRPVKATGGTPVSQYVDITGTWAECNASGELVAKEDKPEYLEFAGTNYSGNVLSVEYGESIVEAAYSRNINEVSLTSVDGSEVNTSTVADVTSVTDGEETKRVISFTANGETKYYIQAEETFDVAAEKFLGKWDFTYNEKNYTINFLDATSCTISDGVNKENVTFDYRFGTISFDSSVFAGTFAVQPIVGGDCPFQFVNSEGSIIFTVHPKTYTVIASWSGVTDTELPSWLTLGSKNSLVSGSDIKSVTDANGNAVSYAIKFNASWPSTSNAFDAVVGTLSIDGGFKTGDRITVKGYTNADGKTGGLKIWSDSDTQLGATSPAVNNFKAGETVMNTASVFTLTSDVNTLYVCREAGTGTFITEFVIEREVED